MADVDARWADEVAALCDPVFEAADVGFVRQVMYADDRRTRAEALLWEADPPRFAERYPDSGIVETYGAHRWSRVHCIDFWVYLEHEARRCRLSAEGWNLPDLYLPLRGSAAADGIAIADTFARILSVPSPRIAHGT